MAECIPVSFDHLDFEPTKGEKRVFEILKQLPDSCRVWYEVVVDEHNRKPDFLILDSLRGSQVQILLKRMQSGLPV